MIKKIGILMFILAVACWIAIPILPFMPISNAIRLTLVPTLIVVAEIFFWSGTAIFGKEIVRKFSKYLNPLNWFKKNDPENAENPEND
ncbi:transporter suffix domain-containing protein [Lutibacter sp. B2]|nr:transporter suffix domain-containing protein [Lutibacter sp. B2]